MMPEQTAPALVNRSCPLCEANQPETRFEKGSLRLVRCKSCSMIYANPVETELASGAFYDRMGTSFYLSPEKLAGDYAPVRFVRELRLFRNYCRSGQVLDVGCSTGAFLFNLKQRFPNDYETVGTDVTSAALDYAESQGTRVIRESFLSHDFRNQRFDAVTFWAVMEHLVQPRQFLAKADAILKPDGFCFILVPNMRSLAVRLLGSKYRYIMPDHVNYFTADTLKAFGDCVGSFECVRLTTTHFNPVVILKDFKNGTGRVPDEARAALLKKTTALKQNPLLKPVRWLYALTEQALASLSLADNLVIVLRKQQ